MRILALAVFGSLFTLVGSAAVIPVNNASFETFNPLNIVCVGAGCQFNIAPIPGWTNSGNTGSWQPGNPANTNYFNSLPDGITLGYSNNAAITQTVAELVQAGLTYTLQVQVGNRKDSNPTGVVELLIGSTAILATGSVPAEGAFSTFTAVYTALAADAGKTIGIRLSSTGEQGDFDNVQLSSSGVPEPATMALMGLSLGLLAALRRRQR